ncbi:MAG TPA: hypothetical protein VHO03_04890 [Ignavibacteriales bacterium]|nr:hypothetical protein [Ignavibacteriales bacterium]
MKALFSPVVIILVLAGISISYGSQDAPINLKQMVQNQIEQIKARAVKQENAQLENKASALQGSQPAADRTDINKTPANKTHTPQTAKVEKEAGFTGGGLFLKVFILMDLSLLAALFVFWRRRKLKIGMAEKAKFKKNISKLRSEARFRRRPQGQTDEVRKRLQTDPVLGTGDEALLLKHAKKLSVSPGELMLASRIRMLEKAHE